MSELEQVPPPAQPPVEIRSEAIINQDSMTDLNRTMRQSIVEARIAVRHKETSHAYLWWLFFGMFGAHRLYLGRTGSGVAQAILTITLVGIVVSLPWVLIDLFLIPSMARKYHAQVKAEEYLGFI